MKRKFSAADLIRPPFRACPKCKQKDVFGVLFVHDSDYDRRCKACWHAETIPLPPIPRRQVIYLDQFVMSDIMKARRRGTTKGLDPYWPRLSRQATRTTMLQLAVFPDSPFHDEETGLARDQREIQSVLAALSGGIHFAHYLSIQQDQLRRCVTAWARGRPISEVEINQEEAIHGELDAWQDAITIYVPPGELPAQTGRSRKQAAKEILVPALRDRARRGVTFEEALQEEAGSFGPAVLSMVWQEAQRKSAIFAGRIAAKIEDFLPSVPGQFYMAIRNGMELAGYTGQDVDFKAIEFLQGETVARVPFVRIRALLYAALSRKMVAGQSPPQPSIATDFEMIATLLPYCDAMFLDRQCAGLLAENPVREELLAYGTQVFSKKTEAEFLAYLSELEQHVSPMHLRAVREVFGDEVLGEH